VTPSLSPGYEENPAPR